MSVVCGSPPDLEVPKDWGIRGLTETISAILVNSQNAHRPAYSYVTPV